MSCTLLFHSSIFLIPTLSFSVTLSLFADSGHETKQPVITYFKRELGDKAAWRLGRDLSDSVTARSWTRVQIVCKRTAVSKWRADVFPMWKLLLKLLIINNATLYTATHNKWQQATLPPLGNTQQKNGYWVEHREFVALLIWTLTYTLNERMYPHSLSLSFCLPFSLKEAMLAMLLARALWFRHPFLALWYIWKEMQ